VIFVAVAVAVRQLQFAVNCVAWCSPAARPGLPPQGPRGLACHGTGLLLLHRLLRKRLLCMPLSHTHSAPVPCVTYLASLCSW
jgi:hypothetical protein